MGAGLICSNSFDMVAESTDDRRVTEAALDSEYICSGKKERGMFYLLLFFLQFGFNMLQKIVCLKF